MFAHFRPTYKDTNTKAFPVNFWGDRYGQSPLFRSKFNSFNARITLYVKKNIYRLRMPIFKCCFIHAQMLSSFV